MLFADSLECSLPKEMECPLSKEELLELVEEEARLRVSAGFLEEVEQIVFLNCISQLYLVVGSLGCFCFRWSLRR